MVHRNRGRVAVDPNGDWTPFTIFDRIPDGAEIKGVVSVGGVSGALVRLPTGAYWQISNDSVSVLDGRKIASALGLKSNGGRKEEMDGGRNITIYLPADSIARAKEIGGGNVSKGIREALKNF